MQNFNNKKDIRIFLSGANPSTYLVPVANKDMEFSNITCHDIVSNKGMNSNITCHGIVSNKGMEISNITCHGIASNKGMEFSNITCHGIVSNKGMEFSNITCHGIVSNKGMEFQYHISWYWFKQGHGVL